MNPPLKRLYHRMLAQFGPRHWWPADSPFEVMVGAILTQNTNWGNVERAIRRLKDRNALDPFALASMRLLKLASLIRPAGYFRVKARRLSAYVRYYVETYHGDWQVMARREPEALRKELLGVHGVGPETADSILLYALGIPVFVVDAYTQRIFSRHGWASATIDYASLQEIFHSRLERDARLYNEFHALIVNVGKDFCRSSPRCETCPLRPFLPHGRPVSPKKRSRAGR